MIAKFLILCVAVGIANAGILKSAAIIAPEIRTSAIITKSYSAPIVHSVEVAPVVETSFIEHRPAIKTVVHAPAIKTTVVHAPAIKTVVHAPAVRTVVHTPKVIVKSAPLLRYASAW